jgi:glycosyltransferase involved in cell wall biosynthesis
MHIDASPDLSIVIPAFKEAAKIERDILAASAFLAAERIAGEIIVVDDGSPDDTAAKAASFQPSVPSLRVLRYERNRGKGHALRCGIAHARGRYVLFADSGLCVPYDIARVGLTMLDLNMCDVAHGSRRMRGSVVREQPLLRRVGSRVFSVIIHTAMGIPSYISDTQCGFKLYRRETAQALYGATVTDGFMYDIEVILRALKAKKRILEFPVLWSNDADSRMSPRRDSLKFLRDLAHIRFVLAGRRAADSSVEPAHELTGVQRTASLEPS